MQYTAVVKLNRNYNDVLKKQQQWAALQRQGKINASCYQHGQVWQKGNESDGFEELKAGGSFQIQEDI